MTLADLSNSNSVIMSLIDSSDREAISDLLELLRIKEVVGRNDFENLTIPISERTRQSLIQYRDLMYHVSGARVVNCESVLPQENYLDYDLLEGRPINFPRVSEEYLLGKLLFETVFSSLGRPFVFDNILRHIPFEAVLEIRQPLAETNFNSYYSNLFSASLGTISGDGEGERTLFNLDELATAHEKIRRTFTEVTSLTKGHFFQEKNKTEQESILTQSMTVGLGIAGAIPGVGLISSAISVLKDSPALILNVQNKISNRNQLKAEKLYNARKIAKLENIISNSQVNEKTMLLDFVDSLSKLVAESHTL